ncbi:hypothetical protein [Kitasatospora phosalacinea]|uniref:hypothetical protein n=1 Tax=Kitasatospora phosalacinea TaxID=2065 RepID=UPI00052663A9|nr:hypothetical protein [Kitasatospora phosalacinea]
MSGLFLLLGWVGVLWVFATGVLGHDWSLAGLIMPLATFALFVAGQLRRGEIRRQQQAAAEAWERRRLREEAEREAPAGPPARPDGEGPDVASG